MKATTFLQTSPQSEVYTRNYGFQSSGSLDFGNFETPNLGVLGKNDIWMQPLWLITKNTIKGKVVTSLKSGPWWVLWICVCPWFVCAPKMLQPHTNQLVVWFVWIINPFITCPSPHPRVLTHLSTFKVLWTKEHTPIPSSFSIVFTFKFTFESFKECGGASIIVLLEHVLQIVVKKIIEIWN
jgi:hypothetical protein